MLRQFLRGKIHRAKVTRADLDYVGSVSIDPRLLELAGILPNECVEIYNITSGHRLKTYALVGEPGEIGINGAAAHLAKKGDLVIICAYGYFQDDELKEVNPKVVLVDEMNRPIKK